MRRSLQAGGSFLFAFALVACAGDNFAPGAASAGSSGAAGASGGGQGARGGASNGGNGASGENAGGQGNAATGGDAGNAAAGTGGVSTSGNGGSGGLAAGAGGEGGASLQGGAAGEATTGGQAGASNTGGGSLGGEGGSSLGGAGGAAPGGAGGAAPGGAGGAAQGGAGGAAPGGNGGNGAGAANGGEGSNGASAATGGSGGNGATAATGGNGGNGATAATGGSGGNGASTSMGGAGGGPPTPLCSNGITCVQPADPCAMSVCDQNDQCQTVPRPGGQAVAIPGNCLEEFCSDKSISTATRPNYLDQPVQADFTCTATRCAGASYLEYDDTLLCPAGRCLGGECKGVCSNCGTNTVFPLHAAKVCGLAPTTTFETSSTNASPVANMRDGVLDSYWQADGPALEMTPTKVQATLDGLQKMSHIHIHARNVSAKSAALHYRLWTLVGGQTIYVGDKTIGVAPNGVAILSFELGFPQQVAGFTISAWSAETAIAIDEIGYQSCFVPTGGGEPEL